MHALRGLDGALRHPEPADMPDIPDICERLLRPNQFRQNAVRGALGSQWMTTHDVELRRHRVAGHLRRDHDETEP